jgi:tetratricopeptide (TPR) repeat protein
MIQEVNMPYTLNGIGTMYYGKKDLREYSGVCEHCKKDVLLRSYETRLWFTIFYIPIIPIQKKMILDQCPACSRHRAVPLKDWNALEPELITDIHQELREKPNDEKVAIQAHYDLIALGKHQEASDLAIKMESKFSKSIDVLLYLSDTYRQVGELDRSDKYLELVLKVDPGNLDVKRIMALRHIEKNEPSKAKELLSFMDRPGPDQNFGVLLLLAKAFQRNNNHSEAYSLFQILIRDFPEIAKTDKKFREAVSQTEQHYGGPSILPKKKFQFTSGMWLGLGGFLVGVLIIGVALIINLNLKNNQVIYAVNELKAKAVVSVGESKPYVVRSSQVTKILVPEGKHLVNIKMEDGLSKSLEIEIANSWFGRFFNKKINIINVLMGAVIVWEETTYSENPDKNAAEPYKFFVGEPFIVIDETDYVFTPFPETIQISQGTKVKKTRVSVMKGNPLTISVLLQRENFNPQKIFDYYEAHLNIVRDNEELLAGYLQIASTYNYLPRGLKFLKENLTQRPVLIEWHRIFQEASKLSGKGDELNKVYDDFLKKEPNNSALLYLRGRITPNRIEAFQYYSRAIKADNSNSYPHFAKAYHYTNSGEFFKAKESCDTAYKLLPKSMKIKSYRKLLQYALGEYDQLVKDAMSRFTKDPINWDNLTSLLKAQVLNKDTKAAWQTLRSYREAVHREMPQDPYQMGLQAELELLHLLKEFKKLKTKAKHLEKSRGRDYYLNIAHMNLLEMEQVENLFKEGTDKYNSLLLWLGWMQKGDKNRASFWKNKAQKAFLSAMDEENQVGKFLNQKVTRIGPELKELTIHPDYKRILYTTFAVLYPKERRLLLDWARKLNFNPDFPHFFLEKIMNGLK